MEYKRNNYKCKSFLEWMYYIKNNYYALIESEIIKDKKNE